MGLFDSWSDILEAAMPWSEARAEAPKEDDEETKNAAEGKDEEEAESKEDEEEEEEEEDEEELEDPKDKIEEECKNSKACSPAKHHFDECVERVTGAADESDKKHPGEDCVEEFFHLAHCANECAAPKLWAVLK